MKKYGTGGPESLASDIEQPSDNLEIDEIMAKLEQDNKFLAELEKQRQRSSNETAAAKTGKQLSPSVESGGSGSGGSPTSSTTLHRAHSAITDSGFLSQSSLAGGAGGHSPTSSSKSNGALHKLPGQSLFLSSTYLLVYSVHICTFSSNLFIFLDNSVNCHLPFICLFRVDRTG